MEKRALTRGAIFYGHKFNEICRTLNISSETLKSDGILSSGTQSKLRRRFRGKPVERSLQERLINYLNEKISSEGKDKLSSKNLVIEDVLLPANYRLSDKAVILAANYKIKVSGDLKDDCLYDHQLTILLKGGYCAERHLLCVLRQLEKLCGEENFGDFEDYYECEGDDHKCYPSIYRAQNQQKEAQLKLIVGGKG